MDENNDTWHDFRYGLLRDELIKIAAALVQVNGTLVKLSQHVQIPNAGEKSAFDGEVTESFRRIDDLLATLHKVNAAALTKKKRND
ncbi:hypothetical protein [Phyllobacterium sp. YR531]|uniref:hypothetical protein n=1 Tax=Phyllobacterium sp. YR531 TaxID=1144343 RepID=UPI00026FBAEF|nr:hypothetical protein [Phyllobacterium sp. YR531]EJN04275.1 hypothetical protein PMI41_01914 [Phyllobacterium sp. YR531]